MGVSYPAGGLPAFACRFRFCFSFALEAGVSYLADALLAAPSITPASLLSRTPLFLRTHYYTSARVRVRARGRVTRLGPLSPSRVQPKCRAAPDSRRARSGHGKQLPGQRQQSSRTVVS